MKIWLDLRFLHDNLYSTFVLELVQAMVQKDTKNSYTIYTNVFLDWFEFKNISQKVVWIPNGSLKEQTKYYGILRKDKNDLMLFFNHYKPIFYTRTYYTLLPTLKEIYYSNFPNYIAKYKFIYLLGKNLKRSYKILCFDQNTSNELIEKYNIEEEKIHSIDWFFPDKNSETINENLKINIRAKYGINNDFFIYSWWEWVEKNYEKLIHAYGKVLADGKKIDLVFLWDSISKNVALRSLILDLKIQSHIHFIWVIKPAEKKYFYHDSLGVIFPSAYEPFPFRLSDPLYFDSPILSSNLKNIQNIFWDSLTYFSSISVNSMYESISTFLKHKKHTTDYSEVKQRFSKENTLKDLLEIIL